MSNYVEEGLKAGYLTKEKYIFRPLNRGLAIKDSNTGKEYPMMEGCIRGFVLKMDKGGRTYISPFKNLEEQKFFEKALNEENLSPTLNNPFWDKYTVRIEFSRPTITGGKEFDMMNINDNLQVKVLKTLSNVALSESEANDTSKEYLLIGSEVKITRAAKQAELGQRAFALYGQMAGSVDKMREFLEVYKIMMNKQSISLKVDSTLDFMTAEVYNIVTDEVENFLEVKESKLYDAYVVLNNAIKAGVIERKGIDSYQIVGTTTPITKSHMIDIINDKTTDEYHSIRQQIMLNENKGKSKSKNKE